MNEQKIGPREKAIRSRGNSAQKSKDSILVETKELVRTMHQILPNISLTQRREGAWHEMNNAAISMMKHFSIARASKGETRQHHINLMIGEMGVIDAMFDELNLDGVLTDKVKIRLAHHMDKMDEGIILWRNSTLRKTLESSTEEVGD